VRSHSLFCFGLLSDSSSAICILLYFFLSSLPFFLGSQLGFFKIFDYSMEPFDVGNLDNCDGPVPLWIL
jgi:hypothetical protein